MFGTQTLIIVAIFFGWRFVFFLVLFRIHFRGLVSIVRTTANDDIFDSKTTIQDFNGTHILKNV